MEEQQVLLATETPEPQTAPQLEVSDVQVPGLSLGIAAVPDSLPSTDQVVDPQVTELEQPEVQNDYQPPQNEYQPVAVYENHEQVTPEEHQHYEERSADATSYDEGSREDGEARGVKRKHEEGSYDDEESRSKRQRTDGENKQTIFIGNLPPDVTETMLTEIFSTAGKIRDIRLNRHRDTGKVKGFGFIEFEEPAFANAALHKNGIEILGRRVNLELSNKSLINNQAATRWKDQRPPPRERPPRNVHAAQQSRPRDSTTVFVGNLDDRVNDDDIYRMFSHCGQIKEIRWLEDKQTGRFKGCGFIDFYTPEATTAAAKMNGAMLHNRPMRVDYATGKPGDDSRGPPQAQQAPPAPVANPLGALGGLNPLVLQQLGLGGHINQLANLLNVQPQAQPNMMGANPLASLLTTNYNNPNLLLQSSLLGQMQNPMGLAPMNAALQPNYGRNDQPSVRQEPSRPRPYGCKTVFVGNLPDSITDDIIRSVFANVGRVVDIRWLNDKKTRRFKGCGFVEFDSEEATERAIGLSGRMVLGQPMRVDYSSPKDGPRESKSHSDSGRNTASYDNSSMMNNYSGSGGLNNSSNYYGSAPSANYNQSNNPAAFGLANNNSTLSALLSSLTGGSGAHPTNQ